MTQRCHWPQFLVLLVTCLMVTTAFSHCQTSSIPLQYNLTTILGQSTHAQYLRMYQPIDMAFNGIDMLYVVDAKQVLAINVTSQIVDTLQTFSTRIIGVTYLRTNGEDKIYVSNSNAIMNLAGVVVAGTLLNYWNGDGIATETNLNNPRGMFALDRNGGEIYFADENHHVIRKFSFLSNNITTIAGNTSAGFSDGLATNSMLNYPHSVHVSFNGEVFIADTFNCKLRKVKLNGQMETIAGSNECGFDSDGKLATQTKINHPRSIRVSNNNEVYFADSANGRIRKITTFGIIKTVAGGGSDTKDAITFVSILYNPTSIELSSDLVYLLESNNHKIRVIQETDSLMRTIAGFSPNTDIGYTSIDNNIIANPLASRLTSSYGIAIDKEGNIYFTDSYASRVLKFDVSANRLRTIVGNVGVLSPGFDSEIDGMLGTNIKMNFPHSLVFDTRYESLYISEMNNHRVIRYNISSGTVHLVAGNGTAGYNGVGLAVNCQLNNPTGLAFSNGTLFIADTKNRRVRKVSSNGILSDINYIFKTPTCIYVESSTLINVLDTDLRGIVTISNDDYYQPFSGALSFIPTFINQYKGQLYYSNSEEGYLTLTSKVKIGSTPGFDENKLRYPTAFTVDQNGTLFICDSGNQMIRKYNETLGTFSVVSGFGSVYQNYDKADPQFVSLSSSLTLNGNNLILNVKDENHVLQYNLDTKLVTNLYGPSLSGYLNSQFDISSTKFSGISGLVKIANQYFVTDYGNNRIRVFTNTRVFDIFGSGSSIVNNPLLDIPRPKLIIPYKENDYLFFSDNTLIRFNLESNNISRIAGEGSLTSDNVKASDILIKGASNLFYETASDSIYYVDSGNVLKRINSNGIVKTVYKSVPTIVGLYVSNISGEVYLFDEIGNFMKLNKKGELETLLSGVTSVLSMVYSETTNSFYVSSSKVYKISVNCPEGYFISNFEKCVPICFGKNTTDACGGIERGNCISPNQCNCTLNYIGSECLQLRIVETSKGNSKDNSIVLIATLVPILTILILIVLLVILIVILIIYFRKKKSTGKSSNSNLELVDSKNVDFSIDNTVTDFPDSEVSTFFRPTLEFQSVSTSTNGTSSTSSSFEPLNRFKDMIKIGSGGFGSVFRAFDVKTNSFKALKVIKFQSYSELNQFMKEGLQLLNMSHPNIIKVNDMFVDKNELLVIEMDYYEKGDLASLLKIQLSETMVKSILLQMLKALEYIHEEKKLIHRDIKESNIFIKELSENHIHVVLADFGLARDNSLSANNSYCGTPMFLSPELGLGASYGFNTDIYSLGVTIYQLMTHDTTTAISHLHFSKDSSQVREILTENMQKPNIYSKDLIEIVIDMLGKDSATRPQAKQLLKLPYLH